MKRFKGITAVLVILCIGVLTAGAFKADAAGGHSGVFGGGAPWTSAASMPSGGSKPFHKPEVVTQIINLMIQLNLTDEQKKAIADILKKYQETLKVDVTAVLEARKALLNTIHADAYNEGAVRDASHIVASAEEELAVVRAEVFSEIKAVLTAEQLAIIAQFKEDALANIKNKVETIQYLIQLWIDKNS